MSTTNEPYRIEMMTVGILAQETIPCVRMSRARFIEVVEQALEGYSQEVHDELMPVARTMPRFPLAQWMDPQRGCGCVVGEWLVARSELNRLALKEQVHGGRLTANASVVSMLSENPLGDELAQFGSDIDEAVKRELMCGDLKSKYGVSLDLDYTEEVDDYVESIEIVD